jgi:hypothetical protein
LVPKDGGDRFSRNVGNKFTITRCVIPQKNKIGKAVPLQSWSGPEVSRNLRFPDFMTTQDGG